MNHQRIKYIDFAKFIAILLVCIGHACKMFDDAASREIYRFIYSFHMPLFMLLSGMFVGRAINMNCGAFLTKKSVKLLVPALVTTIVACAEYSVLNKGLSLSFYATELLGGMWFLKCLFINYLVCYAFSKMTKSFWNMAVLSCIFVFIIPFGDFMRINYFYLCFVAGMIVKQYYGIYERHILCITAVCVIYFLLFGRIGSPPKFEQYDLNQLFVLPKYLASGLSGSLSVLGLSYYVDRYFSTNSIYKLCNTIGLYTLGIYCMQTILLERGIAEFNAPPNLTSLSSAILCVGVGIILCALSWLLSIGFEKNKITRLLFLGT